MIVRDRRPPRRCFFVQALVEGTRITHSSCSAIQYLLIRFQVCCEEYRFRTTTPRLEPKGIGLRNQFLPDLPPRECD
jgi:hypothetical protein